MRISTVISKVIALCGPDPDHTKIIMVHGEVWSKLGTPVTLGVHDIDKLHNFQIICGGISRTLRNKVRGEIKMKFYIITTAVVWRRGVDNKKQSGKTNTDIRNDSFLIHEA